jgi:hypothetical protein
LSKERDRIADGPDAQKEPLCAVCQNPIEVHGYSGQKLHSDHHVTLTIVATDGDTFLPHILEVHGKCLKNLKNQIIEINKGCTWV